MSRELLQRALDVLDGFGGEITKPLRADLRAELAKPEPQPVARISPAMRLEWLCDHDTAKSLLDQKLYTRDGV